MGDATGATANALRATVFAFRSSVPGAVAAGHAALLPIPIAWSIVCAQRALKGASGGTRVHALLASGWALNALDTVALLLHAALYQQCDPAYTQLRPAVRSCPGAMAAYLGSEVLAPLATALFLTTSIARFLLTISALGPTSTYRFLRVACTTIAAALFVKLTALAIFVPTAISRTTDPHDLATFPEAFHMYTEVPFYGLLALLDWCSVILGFRFIYRVMWKARGRGMHNPWAPQPATASHHSSTGAAAASSSSSAISSAFSWRPRRTSTAAGYAAATMSPQVHAQKKRERRLLLWAAALLTVNMLALVTYVLVFLTDAMTSAGVSNMVQNFVYSVLVKLFGSCEMGAIQAAAGAVAANRKAGELLARRDKNQFLVAEGPGEP